MPCMNEDEIENLGYSLIQEDIKRMGNKTSREEDIEKAFLKFRGIVVECGKTSHDFITQMGDYYLYKMRHKIPEHRDKRSGYRLYYATNKEYKYFLPVFVYIRNENFPKREALKIIRERLDI